MTKTTYFSNTPSDQPRFVRPPDPGNSQFKAGKEPEDDSLQEKAEGQGIIKLANTQGGNVLKKTATLGGERKPKVISLVGAKSNS